MQVQHNISLKPYNTFGIDVKAKQFVSVENIDKAIKIIDTIHKSNSPTERSLRYHQGGTFW